MGRPAGKRVRSAEAIAKAWVPPLCAERAASEIHALAQSTADAAVRVDRAEWLEAALADERARKDSLLRTGAWEELRKPLQLKIAQAQKRAGQRR